MTVKFKPVINCDVKLYDRQAFLTTRRHMPKARRYNKNESFLSEQGPQKENAGIIRNASVYL